MQGTIAATTISESEHEDTSDTSTATWNAPPTASPALGDVASSVETPIPAADSGTNNGPLAIQNRAANLQQRGYPTCGLADKDRCASAYRGTVKSAAQLTCTQQQRILGLCG